MKRVLASAGLVAVGAATVQAQYTPGVPPAEQTKPWSITVGVAGFYDDNQFTAPDNSPAKEESWGIAVNPTVGLDFDLERTVITADLDYTLKWYENRPDNNSDQQIVAFVGVTHEFSERYTLDVSDRFIYSDQAEVLLGTGPSSFYGRSDSDYYRNIGRAMFDAELTERFAISVGYQNQIWDFVQTGTPDSYSATLDRMQQLGIIEFKGMLAPQTDVLLGYNMRGVNYNSSDLITIAGGLNPADTRNYRANIIYAGVEHDFSPQLTTALRIGAELNDFYNLADNAGPAASVNYDDSNTMPYVDFVLSYNYNPGSYVNVGVMNTMNSTDVGNALSQSSTAAYLDVNHRLAPKWTLGLIGMLQSSSFNGGVFDDQHEWYFLGGADIGYDLNKNLRAELGYTFDQVDSDISVRDFMRNRVWFGFRAIF